jgi:hypothetical protein
MATENPQLAVDEKLFLLATRVLADLEDKGESFELVNTVSRFSQAPYLAIRFQNAIGRELGALRSVARSITTLRPSISSTTIGRTSKALTRCLQI